MVKGIAPPLSGKSLMKNKKFSFIAPRGYTFPEELWDIQPGQVADCRAFLRVSVKHGILFSHFYRPHEEIKYVHRSQGFSFCNGPGRIP